jgi:acyl-CoA synthetase (AMP-forming)/AMP-acid ligase II
VPRAAGAVDAAALELHCRKNLAPYKIPRDFVILDRLPKTAVGKIDKKQLL